MLSKYITLMQNRVILFCIQKPLAPPIYVQYSELCVVYKYSVNSYQNMHF